MNIGEMGNFISYGFAPASVVAPLGTVSDPYEDSTTYSEHLLVCPNCQLRVRASNVERAFS